jgi:hypothetical protein
MKPMTPSPGANSSRVEDPAAIATWNGQHKVQELDSIL